MKEWKLLLAGFLSLASLSAAAQTVEYIHTDALGTPIAVTNASRVVIERSEYEPYGKLLNRPLTDGPGYTGHVQDAATGLTYMQQRYYDPGIGRFLSVDPVTADSGTGANFNRYWYADNNPYRFVDPDGRAPESVMDRRVVYSRLSPEQVEGVEAQHSEIGSQVGAGMAAGVAVLLVAVPDPTDALVAGVVVKAVGSAAKSGRSANRVAPNPRAGGPHSTIKRDADGNTSNTATYEPNSRNPSGFQETKRVDVTGKSHRNPDGTVVPTPHVKEAGSKGVRPARPEELPRPKPEELPRK